MLDCTKGTVIVYENTTGWPLPQLEHICTADTDNATKIQKECVAAFRWQQRLREHAKTYTSRLLIIKHIPQLLPTVLHAYKLSDADSSGRAVYGVGLLPLACWNCGFISSRRHRCLCLVSVVCCQVEVSASGWSLVQRSPECDHESSIMRRPWPTGAVAPC